MSLMDLQKHAKMTLLSSAVRNDCKTNEIPYVTSCNKVSDKLAIEMCITLALTLKIDKG